jgi:hypothetical protein
MREVSRKEYHKEVPKGSAKMRENADNSGQLKAELEGTCCKECGRNVEVETETGLCEECLNK